MCDRTNNVINVNTLHYSGIIVLKNIMPGFGEREMSKQNNSTEQDT